MSRKRNVDKVVRGKKKPYMVAENGPRWVVTATETAGAKLEANPFYDEASALRHADWWFTHPGVISVEVLGPKYTGALHHPTEADRAVGEGMVDLLECSKVGPVAKYHIGRWMDSKAWGGDLSADT